MPELAPATAPVTNNMFEQHPDTLIKKHNRKEDEKPAIDPVVEAATTASLEELKSKLPSLLFGDKPKEKTAEELKAEADAKTASDAKAAKEKADAGKTEEQIAAEAKAVEDAKVEKVLKVTRQPDAAELARIQAAEFARIVEENRQAAERATAAAAAPRKDEPVVETAPAHLSEADKDAWELFKVLSDSEPKRYAGRHKEFVKFVDKLSVYKKNWAKANPNEEYEKADHSEFYDTNQPAYTEEDLGKARIRRETQAEVERRLSEQRAQFEGRLREVEQRAVVPEVNREAAKVANDATNVFLANLPDETLKTEVAKGPVHLKEADPLAYEVLNTAASDLQFHVTELHNIVSRPGYYNPQNAAHRNLSGFIEQQEAHIKGLPGGQQMFEGKAFATRSDYQAMSPALRARHWTLTEPDVVHMLTQATTARATQTLKNERSRIESMAVKYGFAKAPASAGTQAEQAAAAEKAKRAAAKPQSPAGAAGDAGQPLAAKGKTDDLPVEKSLVKSLF